MTAARHSTGSSASQPAPQASTAEELPDVEALERLDGAFNRLWSNGPVIDTIADWGRDWTHDPDPTFYDLLKDCRDAVRAALQAASESSDRTENCRICDLTYPAGTKHRCTDGWASESSDTSESGDIDALWTKAAEEVKAEHSARYVDLRIAVELADTRTGVVAEKDGVVEVYSLKAADWNRVVAVARGFMSQKTRRTLDSFVHRTARASSSDKEPE